MRRVLGTAVAMVLLAATGWSGASAAVSIDAATLPTSMHGAVETQAVTVGNGAVALFADPGTAYAYSTLDRDDYGEGSESFTMTARGANLNLGVIPYAVLWAAPECRAEYDGPNFACVASGQVAPGAAPNTGLQEAKGFPAYAEALYPPPPADSGQAPQVRVYKCIVNKDGAGSPPSNGTAQSVCKQSDGIPLTAWAEAIGEEYRATGFSRAGGFDAGLVKVGNNESYSQVVPIGGGKVVSEGYSVAQNISLLGGQITIDSVRAAARIVSASTGEAQRSGSCTFQGLKIEGQAISSNGSELPYDEVAPLLQGIAEATGYLVELVPPQPMVSRVEEGSKQVVSCAGFQIRFTDTHTESPVPVCLPAQIDPSLPQCVPALANREEISFGRITVQQSVNNAGASLSGTVDDLLGGGGDVGGLDVGAGSDFGPDLSASGGLPGDLLGGAGSLTSPGSSGGAAGGNGNGSVAGGDFQTAAHTVNSGQLGVLAAVSSLAWLVAILVLFGVVNSLATGARLRLPGF